MITMLNGKDIAMILTLLGLQSCANSNFFDVRSNIQYAAYKHLTIINI